MKIINTPILFAIILGLTASAAFGQNYKIKQTTSISGHNMESTVYVKGSRKRTENGGMMGMANDVATIEQCDLKRTVQVNDKKKLYYVEPTTLSEPDSAPVAKAPVATTKATKGGTVTYTSAITDTGERKQMFGLTARHIKTSMTMVSSPDACSKQNMKIDTDGWYVDLPLFSCPFPVTSAMRNPAGPTSSGCEDRIIMRSTGTGKLGFPLQTTQTMVMDGRDVAIGTSMETIEFSRATLDDALFNVPATYTLASNSQALYGTPDYSAMMKNAGNDDNEDMSPALPRKPNPSTVNNNSVPAAKKAGAKRIGVLLPTNRTSEVVSAPNLQAHLIRQLNVGNVEAVAVNSEADAKALDCDYILSSDISKLKQSTASKIGGLFGKVTSTDTTAARNYEAQVDFKLTTVTTGQSILQNKATAKIAGDADTAAQGVLGQEATAVLAVAK